MNQLSATIAASGSLSGSVDLTYGALVGIYVPASWTTANITLQASFNGTNFFDIRNVGGDDFLLEAGTGNCFIPLVPIELQGARFIKVRSGTPAAAVNQVAERILTLVTRIIPV
jgi:hypothetical protein